VGQHLVAARAAGGDHRDGAGAALSRLDRAGPDRAAVGGERVPDRVVHLADAVRAELFHSRGRQLAGDDGVDRLPGQLTGVPGGQVAGEGDRLQ
jgi:hypothetical protein